ncbi:MAG TPA: GGDEF domain-containing protein [Ideonella sp.]|uniref:GGDEF domain-containing protein n=1 Tax=Ideonella sp. TaxID=1929293 RepID=UPI002E2F7329|nr:GGDEF domain-containing protein [Ideonella sp.]HEX5682871.1 GGDEF domain-containing protein [Ideonella sp.]
MNRPDDGFSEKALAQRDPAVSIAAPDQPAPDNSAARNWEQRLSGWIFTNDPRQRIRLGQTALANAIMAGCVMLLHAGADVNSPEHRWVWPWTIAALGGMLAVFAAIRSGINQQWRDPSLAMFQMLYAVAIAAGGYVLAGPVRSAALPILAVILMFGMFGLSVRQVVAVGVYAAVMFGAASFYWIRRDAGDPAVLTFEKVNFGMLLLMLMGVCILTSRLAGMRERSKRQKAALEAALEQNRMLATQDALTGCLNRRAMTERLGQAMALAARFGTPCSVIMIDLDHFKHVNDAYGHAAGDEVLRTVAELARAQLRDVDALGRWGGEEFLVLLPATSAQDAIACAERLQKKLAEVRFPNIAEDLHLSFSAGVAAIGRDDGVATLIDRADRAMYQAKQAGRARVVPAEG